MNRRTSRIGLFFLALLIAGTLTAAVPAPAVAHTAETGGAGTVVVRAGSWFQNAIDGGNWFVSRVIDSVAGAFGQAVAAVARALGSRPIAAAQKTTQVAAVNGAGVFPMASSGAVAASTPPPKSGGATGAPTTPSAPAEKPTLQPASGISEPELTGKLAALETALTGKIAALTATTTPNVSLNEVQAELDAFQKTLADTNKLNQLSGIIISSPTFTGNSTPSGLSFLPLAGGSLSGALSVSGTLSGSGILTLSPTTGTSTISSDVAFDTNTLYVDSVNHRVGFGTSSPSDTVAVNGPVYFAPVSAPAVTTDRLYNIGSNLYFGGALVGGGSVGTWTLSGTNVYRASGNVGIGTTSPYATLSVAGSSALGNSALAGYFVATSTTATSTLAGGLSIGGGLKLTNITGLMSCAQFDTNGNLSGTGSACGSGAGSGFSTTSAVYWFMGQTGDLTVGSFTGTSTATSTLHGDLDTSGIISSNTYVSAPSFRATSTTATSTFAGPLKASIYDWGGQVYNVQAYGVVPGDVDTSGANSTAMLALLATVNNAGGGTVYFPPGTYRFDSQLLLPNDGSSPQQNQNNIRMTGAAGGAAWYGSNAAILDLRYVSGNQNAKIETRGKGTLAIDHLTIKDGGASNATPMIHTTNTTLVIDNNTFIMSGNVTQDAIVLGGTTTTVSTGVNSPFQGYTTRITNNHFRNGNRGLYGLTYANAVLFQGNSFQGNTGTVAIEFDGSNGGGQPDYGNSILDNTIEMDVYTYGIKGTTLKESLMSGNGMYDPGSNVSAYYNLNSLSTQNRIICGTSPTSKTFLSGDAASTNATSILCAENGMLDPSGNGSASSQFTYGAVVTGTYDSSKNYPGPLTVSDQFTPARHITIGFDDANVGGVIDANSTGIAASNLLLNPSGGKIGVGTTSPFAKFSIAGSAGASTNLLALSTSTGSFSTTTTFTINQNGDVSLLNGASLAVAGGFSLMGSATLGAFTATNGTATSLVITGLASTSALTISGLGNTSTQCLHINNQGVVSPTGSDCGSGGATPPGGSDTQIQYNSSGSFGGSSNLVWSYGNNRLGIGTSTPGTSLAISGVASFAASGSTLLSSLTLPTLTATSTSATSTLPNLSFTNLGTPFTTGSIPFVGVGGVLNQNNSKLFWDGTNNRLGIGNAAPGTPLDITVDGSGQGFKVIGTAGTLDFTQGGVQTGALITGSTVPFRFGTGAGATIAGSELDLQANGVTALAIILGGNVGIGTNNPSYRLTVNGTAAFPALMNDATGYYVCLNTSSGQLATSTTACGASSERFKQNIEPINYGLSQVMELNPVQFDWKPGYIPNPTHQIGFIAEQVAPIIPEVIGYDSSGQIANLDYPKLTAVLAKAIQELNSKVDNLAANGIAAVKDLVVNTITAIAGTFAQLTVGSPSAPTGITLYSPSGQPFCITVGDDGTTHSAAGVCGGQASTSASSSTATSTGPTIALLGNNPAEVTIGANFVDPGATAAASDGTSLMPDIATSTVNTGIAGSYEVVWVVHDGAMNWATSTRTVIVSAAAASGTTGTTTPEAIAARSTIQTASSSPSSLPGDTASTSQGTASTTATN